MKMKKKNVLTLRTEKEDYEFIKSFAEKEHEDLSKFVRELLKYGRIFLAIDLYEKNEVSLERGAEIAGVCLSKFMDILSDFGVKSNLDEEDFGKGLENLKNLAKK